MLYLANISRNAIPPYRIEEANPPRSDIHHKNPIALVSLPIVWMVSQYYATKSISSAIPIDIEAYVRLYSAFCGAFHSRYIKYLSPHRYLMKRFSGCQPSRASIWEILPMASAHLEGHAAQTRSKIVYILHMIIIVLAISYNVYSTVRYNLRSNLG